MGRRRGVRALQRDVHREERSRRAAGARRNRQAAGWEQVRVLIISPLPSTQGRGGKRPVRNEAVTAYIALGANLGDRERNIRDAVDRLGASDDIEVIRVSTLLENPAVGGPAGAPAFLNAAAQL